MYVQEGGNGEESPVSPSGKQMKQTTPSLDA